jgi:outer membrane biogenesis lipoprotein LolB
MKINFQIQIIILLLAILIVSGCSSANKTKSEVKPIALMPINHELYRLEANCMVNSSMNNQSFNFRIKVNISGSDTVAMTIYGPFGITVGRLYSDLQYFRFHNIMENVVYQGSPSQENIKKATNLSISIRDFLSLFQGKTPFDISDYKVTDGLGNNLLLKRVDGSNFGDFALLDKTELNLVQYQRKDKGDILILNSSFDKFKRDGKSYLPSSINIMMPTVDGKMIIEVESFKTNADAAIPIKFEIPASVKIVELN